MWLPKALYLGIAEEKFWHMNPRKMEPYAEAMNLRVQDENRRIEVTAWANGLYVHKAVGAIFGKHAPKYPNKPETIFTDGRAEKNSLTDADRFYQYMVWRNAQKKQQTHGE